MSDRYHFTCTHGFHEIRGVIRPGGQLGRYDGDGPWRYSWFTDMDTPIRDALGLTSHILTCNRTEYRYRVTDARDLVHWTHVRRDHAWAEELESAPGARPMHWWVSAHPVPVTYDPVEVKP